ncbi:AAA family ATPase [Chitinophaga sancti]|uniref:AAA domain-containing protein n=1 Tax=Chitinophaga sancti TaxID=1004 RepID=A0A1K1RKP9_9BACT|nr:AAA family ATPase [Chitinophaga sancti]WQD60799.1 AAA family ATPase [Chitinophaga sancti]WQG87073.1 AAA family ATPase [Chitinophaga sancti]SFW72589.1 AAA domain-containing protein [Chitinophaga sancti]
MIKRILESVILQRLFKGKAVIIFGPRQSGKSTLTEALLNTQEKEWLYMNGDEADIRELLTNTTSAKLSALVGNKVISWKHSARLYAIEDLYRNIYGIR